MTRFVNVPPFDDELIEQWIMDGTLKPYQRNDWVAMVRIGYDNKRRLEQSLAEVEANPMAWIKARLVEGWEER